MSFALACDKHPKVPAHILTGPEPTVFDSAPFPEAVIDEAAANFRFVRIADM
ncbi:hypothetical protein ACTTAK_18070 (plasmid) [Rhodobacter capsulatus]|uniref:hypothetical protein n=1 Tax=Rhodobacter capsulatus TaxID=1061 RepID=UPI004029C3E5